jgi:hypothetical protein
MFQHVALSLFDNEQKFTVSALEALAVTYMPSGAVQLYINMHIYIHFEYTPM